MLGQLRVKVTKVMLVVGILALLARMSWDRPEGLAEGVTEGAGGLAEGAGAKGVNTSEEQTPLILLWNNYQEDRSSVYRTIFHRYLNCTVQKCISNY